MQSHAPKRVPRDKSDIKRKDQSSRTNHLSEPRIARVAKHLIKALTQRIKAQTGFKRVHFTVAPQQGNLNYTYLISSKLSSPAEFVLKVKNAKEDEHPLHDPLSHTYRREIALLKMCRKLSLPVPQPSNPVWKLGEHRNEGPFVAFLQSYLPGITGRQLSPARGEAELQLYKCVGTFAHLLHQIKRPQNVRIKNLFPSKKALVAAFTTVADRFEEKYLTETESANYQERKKALLRSRGMECLVHADLHLGNVLFIEASCSLAGVVDWERAHFSQREEEFARILYDDIVLAQGFSTAEVSSIFTTQDGVTPRFSAFLAGYGLTIEQYKSEFQQKTETFLALLCLNFWFRFEEDGALTRPDWRPPADYARQVAREVFRR